MNCLLADIISRNHVRAGRGESHLLQELNQLSVSSGIPAEEMGIYLEKRLTSGAMDIVARETQAEIRRASDSRDLCVAQFPTQDF
jgi:hypothetical protein